MGANKRTRPSLQGASQVKGLGGVSEYDSDLPVDPNEPTYCTCKRVAFGEMVGCDNNDARLLSLRSPLPVLTVLSVTVPH